MDLTELLMIETFSSTFRRVFYIHVHVETILCPIRQNTNIYMYLEWNDTN